MKKICIIFVALILMSVCGCAGSKNADESLAGKYIPVTGEMMGIALVGDDLNGFAIELSKGGKGTMTVEGDSGKIKWKNDESTVTVTVDGVDMVATRGENSLVFDDMLEMGIKMTFAKEGTDAANPELYLPETDKYMLGSWQSVDVTDILGNPLESSEMKPDAFAMTVRGDHTADLTVEGENFKDLKWSNMGNYGSIENDDVIKVTWEIKDDGISVDYVKNDVYYTFFCPKTSGNDEGRSSSAADSDQGKESGTDTDEAASEATDEASATDSGSDETSSASGKLGAMLADPSSDCGRWVLFNVQQNGHVYMEDELENKGIEAWIEMEEDGTGRINLVGDLMDMKWGDGHITVPDNGEGGSDEYKYTIANEYLVLVDEGMVLTFRK